MKLDDQEKKKENENSIEWMNKRKNGIKLIRNCSISRGNKEALPSFLSVSFFLHLPVFLWKILWFRFVNSRMTIKRNPETKRKWIFFFFFRSSACLPFFRKRSKTNNEKRRREWRGRGDKNESICTDSKRIKWRERFSTSTSFLQHRLVQSEIVLIRRRMHDPVHGKYWMAVYSQKSNITTEIKKKRKGQCKHAHRAQADFFFWLFLGQTTLYIVHWTLNTVLFHKCRICTNIAYSRCLGIHEKGNTKSSDHLRERNTGTKQEPFLRCFLIFVWSTGCKCIRTYSIEHRTLCCSWKRMNSLKKKNQMKN